MAHERELSRTPELPSSSGHIHTSLCGEYFHCRAAAATGVSGFGGQNFLILAGESLMELEIPHMRGNPKSRNRSLPETENDARVAAILELITAFGIRRLNFGEANGESSCLRLTMRNFFNQSSIKELEVNTKKRKTFCSSSASSGESLRQTFYSRTAFRN